MAKLLPNDCALINNVRLSYPHIFTPRKDEVDDEGNTRPGRYDLRAIIDPSTDQGLENLAILKKLKQKVLSDKFGAKIPAMFGDKADVGDNWTKVPVRDGDKINEIAESKDKDPDESIAGMYVLNAGCPKKNPPQIIGNRKVMGRSGKKEFPELKEEDGLIYAGCYVNLIVRFWVQDNDEKKGGKRVNVELKLVQFYANGDAFGSAPIDPNDAIDDEDVAGGDFDDDPSDSYGGDDGSEPDDLEEPNGKKKKKKKGKKSKKRKLI